MLLLHTFLLLLRQSPEELYFFFIGRFPLIVDLKCALEMLFHLDIESLWLDIYERWIVYSWNRLSRDQVMQVSCKLCELCAGRLFLSFVFLHLQLSLILLKLLSNFLVLNISV